MDDHAADVLRGLVAVAHYLEITGEHDFATSVTSAVRLIQASIQSPAGADEVPRVLALDDSATTLHLISTCLGGLYGVEAYSDPDLLMEALRDNSRPVAVVLLDLNLPGQPGDVVATRLHPLTKRFRRPPRLVLHSSESLVKLGCIVAKTPALYSWIVKPPSTDEGMARFALSVADVVHVWEMS